MKANELKAGNILLILWAPSADAEYKEVEAKVLGVEDNVVHTEIPNVEPELARENIDGDMEIEATTNENVFKLVAKETETKVENTGTAPTE